MLQGVIRTVRKSQGGLKKREKLLKKSGRTYMSSYLQNKTNKIYSNIWLEFDEVRFFYLKSLNGEESMFFNATLSMKYDTSISY